MKRILKRTLAVSILVIAGIFFLAWPVVCGEPWKEEWRWLIVIISVIGGTSIFYWAIDVIIRKS